MHERLVTPGFRRAAVDYHYLCERSYARASALKLVGDRFQLDSTQRSMLYRGVARSDDAAARTKKLTRELGGRPLHVDALNVLYTVVNYLYGRVLFISTDGWLRDAAEVHGAELGPAHTKGGMLDTAVALVMSWLSDRRPSEVVFYVDEPVSLSGELAARLRAELASACLSGTAKTVHSADFPLKRIDEAIVATSDSTIIDAVKCPVCDLAHEVLEERFAPEFVDLRTLLAGPASA